MADKPEWFWLAACALFVCPIRPWVTPMNARNLSVCVPLLVAFLSATALTQEGQKFPTQTGDEKAQLQLGLKDETPNASAQPPKAKETPVEKIKNILGLGVYVQTSGLLSNRNPNIGYHVFDHKAETVTADLVQLSLNRPAATGGFGGRLKVSHGETAKFIHARGWGFNDGDEAAHTSRTDLTELYGEYVVPIGSGLKLGLGKFVTMHGAEVIEAIDNPNLSRGFLFNYAIPFTHTGFKASYTFAEQLTLGLYVVQGWDNVHDNNDAKTLGYAVTYTPNDKVSLTLNHMHGPEQKNDESNQRHLVDFIASYKPRKDLTLSINLDHGWEENAATVTEGDLTKQEGATWRGVAGYVKYEPRDWLAFALRAEWFSDEDGVRTGRSQELKEVTLSMDFKWKGFIIRPEYRRDWSNRRVFEHDKSSSQDIVGVGVMYRW